MLDTSSHRPVVVPTAPPPDVVSHIIEDENSNTPEEAADTNQLVGNIFIRMLCQIYCYRLMTLILMP